MFYCMSKLNRAIPEIKRTVKSFLIEERGSISKHRMVSLGAFLGSASLLGMLPTVQAAHTNSFTVNWDSGTVTAEHSHHGSHDVHASHGSHGSHDVHASHGSHGSHASHDVHASHDSHGSHFHCTGPGGCGGYHTFCF